MPDINELKLQHYRDRVAVYEDQIAQLRAELTLAQNELATKNTEMPEPEEEPKTTGPRRPR